MVEGRAVEFLKRKPHLGTLCTKSYSQEVQNQRAPLLQVLMDLQNMHKKFIQRCDKKGMDSNWMKRGLFLLWE